jgi:hypothetical protein
MGECKDSGKKPEPSRLKDCVLQQMVLAKPGIALDHAPPAVFFSTTPVPFAGSTLLLTTRQSNGEILVHPDRGSPPDLNLLHSVFRI